MHCHGFERNCQTCTVKEEGFLCYLAPAAAKEFEAIKSFFTYPTGSFLFLGPTGVGKTWMTMEIIAHRRPIMARMRCPAWSATSCAMRC